MTFTITSTRSNRNLFIHHNTGSPHEDLVRHISELGQIARLDFERYGVAGEVIFKVDEDFAPTNQQDEEARIGTLAYALCKLGDPAEAAEFMRCLNAICDGGDALSRQVTAHYYYSEITIRGAGDVLKEMGLLAMQLAGLHATWEVVETGDGVWDEMNTSPRMGFDAGYEGEPRSESIERFFDQEVEAIARMTRGRRKGAGVVYDETTEWLNDLEASGASLEELDEAFAHVDAMEQYDEGGAVILMGSHERTVSCGQLDAEITIEDLPVRARYLADELRRAYTIGVEMGVIWEEIDAQIKSLFPVSGRTSSGARFHSHANRELQYFTRQCLEALLDDCRQDFHLTALRTSPSYRRFYGEIRSAVDTRTVGEMMKRAYEARQSGALSVKHLIALKTAATLQRERLDRAPISSAAHQLIKAVNTASPARLKYLSWAFYGQNQPANPIHRLAGQEAKRVWEALNARKRNLPVCLEARDGVKRHTCFQSTNAKSCFQ
jgi:hypothetical protein